MMKTNQYLLRQAVSIVLKAPDISTVMNISAPTIMILSEGCGMMTINERAIELSFGYLLFVHARANVEITSSSNSNFHLYVIQFDQYKRVIDEREQLLYRIDGEGLPENGLIAAPRFGTVLGLFKAIIEAGKQSDATSNPFEEQRLLLELLHEVFIAGPKIPYFNQETPIQKAIHYIKENYNTKLNRPFLAQLTGYHPHYLSKQFNRQTGQSISDFILQLRTEKAKELLSTTNSHINEIATAVGYQDALYFSRKFSQATGMYPTEFRQTPKRIVAFQYIGTLLALGITPVGVESRIFHYSQQLKGELKGVTSFEEWDFNQVRRLQPDIIVAPNYLRPDQLQQLRAIAPVISQSWEEICPIERIRLMGQILGKQKEAESWIVQFNQMADQHKRRLKQVWQPEETVAAYEIADGQVYVLGRQDRGAYAIYDVLGFLPPEIIHNNVLKAGKSRRIALDELPAYGADHMVVSIYEEGGMEQTTRLLASREWRQLPAVQNNRIHMIPANKCFSNDGVSLQKLTVMIAQALLSYF
ncbi:AraC family transcriptional regulator [Paenibacillus sp. LHD-38]|uniref:AraC family transcriptional regulator n=1 Tax=Paenibacillus sp. LHD-38 TaxID=3072143 RepID=UPI00280F5DAC|nr:AraC family transcriptional regulator [Paenibacillus sp. LHD-38]MDQ8737461.1 AraC family transcriptional regulator [Paenibacillus sp. LHD-38]